MPCCCHALSSMQMAVFLSGSATQYMIFLLAWYISLLLLISLLHTIDENHWQIGLRDGKSNTLTQSITCRFSQHVPRYMKCCREHLKQMHHIQPAQMNSSHACLLKGWAVLTQVQGMWTIEIAFICFATRPCCGCQSSTHCRWAPSIQHFQHIFHSAFPAYIHLIRVIN